MTADEQFSAAVRAKARKYVDSGRVMQDAEVPTVWWVESADTTHNRPYRVQVTLSDAEVTSVSCTCSHGKHSSGEARCSHALAALAGLSAQRKTGM